MWLTDMQKIGVGLTSFGAFFMFLGVIMLFDGALLAMGNILFVSGLPLVIGPRKTGWFFARRDKWRGSLCFFAGLILVFLKRPFYGMLIETFGFINLFGDFFPVVVAFLRQVPIIGPVLSMPVVRQVTDRIVGRRAASCTASEVDYGTQAPTTHPKLRLIPSPEFAIRPSSRLLAPLFRTTNTTQRQSMAWYTTLIPRKRSSRGLLLVGGGGSSGGSQGAGLVGGGGRKAVAAALQAQGKEERVAESVSSTSASASGATSGGRDSNETGETSNPSVALTSEGGDGGFGAVEEECEPEIVGGRGVSFVDLPLEVRGAKGRRRTWSAGQGIVGDGGGLGGSGKEADEVVRVTVLLDGDGDVFHHTLFQLGFIGGQRAAQAIEAHVKRFVASKFAVDESRISLMVFVFLNGQGLVSHLSKTLPLSPPPSPSTSSSPPRSTPTIDLAAFSHGFASTAFPSAIIDTGRASQSADMALKNHLIHHLPTSSLVLIGGSHDGGYARALLALPPSYAIKEKVVIVQTSSICANAVKGLGCEVWRFDGEGVFAVRESGGGVKRKSAGERRRSSASGSSGMGDGVSGPGEDGSAVASAGGGVKRSSVGEGGAVQSQQMIVHGEGQGRGKIGYTKLINAPPTSPIHLPPSPSSRATKSFSTIPQPAPFYIPPRFQPLISVLIAQHSAGYSHPLQYSIEAERLGIVGLGGGLMDEGTGAGEKSKVGREWIRLMPKYWPRGLSLPPDHHAPPIAVAPSRQPIASSLPSFGSPNTPVVTSTPLAPLSTSSSVSNKKMFGQVRLLPSWMCRMWWLTC
ncbi:hypothetical protein MNV49_003365 [Pseudohyphozyma bogoriensis]|nr:hypothetical protein MNV49_003365 [Pseudohyphozyma bogoriensis]